MIRRPLAALAVLALAAACGSDSSSAPKPPTYSATLRADAERPNPVNLPNAGGSASVVKNGNVYTYTVTYSGLTGSPTISHIHGPANSTAAAGILVNFTVPAGLPANSGSFSGTFTAADIVASRGVSGDSLDVLLKNGNSYVNVHSAANPGGEIRGQLLAQ